MKRKTKRKDKPMTTETTPLRGKELLKAAVNQIIQHPETWDQSRWHCGTSHCIGGWCQVLAGFRESDDPTQMRNLLGIEKADSDYLFSGSRTLPQIYDFAKVLIEGGDFFDRDGFDRDGRDRDGFDRDGRDRDGFDRDGFDRAGRDRDGFDRDGRDRDGFDRDGFDRDGRDRDGRDRDGRDENGNPLPLLV